ncbi:hypothetical protein MPSEU_000115100 [Mayamaea pseudoterrestris]|nr:hypothetical protein MPSEU_000115100 [Mayamaea pseudoterrestris]
MDAAKNDQVKATELSTSEEPPSTTTPAVESPVHLASRDNDEVTQEAALIVQDAVTAAFEQVDTMEQQQQQSAEASSVNTAMLKARAPLTNLYGSFVIDSDTCLQDARQRLQTALDQTMQLRKAFTDRVFDKYQVCLVPPNDRRELVRKDPVNMYSKLIAEHASLKEEKEMERKSPRSEELAYYSAGLSLVVLPEQAAVVDPTITASAHPERAPQQRARSLSQAAAAAGDHVLDRSRRAAAMRIERHRVRQAARASADDATISTAFPAMTAPPVQPIQPDGYKAASATSTARKRKMSELSAASSTAPPAAPPPSAKQSSPATTPRQRQQGGLLSVSSLLSLAPGADEFMNESSSSSVQTPSAATKALIAKTFNLKTTQQRLKHPHPESMGGKRRTNQTSTSKQQEPFLQAYLALTLPPLPVPKDKAERKSLPLDADAATNRAKQSVANILQLFNDEPNGVSKIQLQLGLNKLQKRIETASASRRTTKKTAGAATSEADMLPPPPRPVSDEPSPDSSIDPMLTFSVLESLGLFTATKQIVERELLPPLLDEKSSIWSDDLKSIRHMMEERVKGQNTTLMDQFLSSAEKKIEKKEEKLDSQVAKNKMRTGSKRKHSDTSSSSAAVASSSSRSRLSNPVLNINEQHSVLSAAVVAAPPPLPQSYNAQQLQDSYNHMAMPQFGNQHHMGAIAGFNQFPTQIQPLPHMPHQFSSMFAGQQHQIGQQGYSHVGQVMGALFPQSTIPGVYPNMSQQHGVPTSDMSISIPGGGNGPKSNIEILPRPSPGDAASSERRMGNLDNSRAQASSQPVIESKAPLPAPPAVRISGDTGLHFVEPDEPASLPEAKADMIKNGRFSEIQPLSCSSEVQAAAIEYLMALGAAVPIPKTLIAHAIKERLGSPVYKSVSKQPLPNVARDLIVANILVWLWANHEDCFQRAFEKSGRVDVDPECKWLIQATVDTSTRALAFEFIEQSNAGAGPLVEYNDARKNAVTQKQANAASALTESGSPCNNRQVELCTVIAVNKALIDKIFINDHLNKAIPQFQNHLDYLDELRLCALRTKAQERTMLANLMARNTTMNEAFANAYTSSVIRAGEILGHDKLFEAVQDAETTKSCSMMPHDILSGDGDAWEDPCKPPNGYTMGLNGSDLMRRAHARAMLHKSLKKLQDRNNIRGGVPDFGPYVDPNIAMTVPTAQVKMEGMSPRVDSKKRRPSLSDLKVPPGTGSAQAGAWSQYEPRHVCDPVAWQPNHVQNTPYGLHRRGEVVRSLSVALSSRSGEPRSMKKSRRAVDAAAALSPPLAAQVVAPVDASSSAASDKKEDAVPRSTQEINWAEVAGIFQKVEVQSRHKTKEDPSVAASLASANLRPNVIRAPSCRRVDSVVLEEGESDTEEDLTDETVLGNHQAILDVMKEKIAAYFEKRKEQQQDRRRKSLISKKHGSK